MVRGRLLIRTSQSVGAWVLPLPAVVVILMIGVQQLWLLHFEALWSRALSELLLYSGFVQYWTGGGRWHEYALYRMADPLPHFVLQRVP